MIKVGDLIEVHFHGVLEIGEVLGERERWGKKEFKVEFLNPLHGGITHWYYDYELTLIPFFGGFDDNKNTITKPSQKPKDVGCVCGAKHTSNPKHHLNWCNIKGA
jgi:hypothetical protein